MRELNGVFEQMAGRRSSIEEQPSRPGDAVGAFADIEKAHRLLGWEPVKSLEDESGGPVVPCYFYPSTPCRPAIQARFDRTPRAGARRASETQPARVHRGAQQSGLFSNLLDAIWPTS